MVTLLDLLNIYNAIQGDLQIMIKSMITTTRNDFELLNRNSLLLIIRK